MITLYEGFIKKVDKLALFNEVFNNVHNYLVEKFKDYKDYRVMKYDWVRPTNMYDKISLYDKFNYRNDLIKITIELCEKKFIITFENSSYFRRSTYFQFEFNYKKIEYDKIYNVINQLEEYGNSYDTLNYIDILMYRNSEKSGQEINTILIKDYDAAVKYIMKKDSKFVKYINFDRCSKEVKNKYQHYLNASNFDLL